MTPAGEGEMVGKVIRDGKVDAYIVMVWNFRPSDPAIELSGMGLREALLFPVDQFIEVKDGPIKILRRIS
jgi:hypothetical protein